MNKIRNIVYRSTEKKTLKSNAIIKFKLGNPIKAKKYKGLQIL